MFTIFSWTSRTVRRHSVTAVTLALAFLLASPHAHACREPQRDTLFFGAVPSPAPEADLVAEVSLSDFEGIAMGEKATTAIIIQVIQTSDTRVRQGDKVLVKYEGSSCGPDHRTGDKGTIIARTGTDSEGRLVLYPYSTGGSGHITPPLQWTTRRSPIALGPSPKREELAKLNLSCSAFYDIAKEKLDPKLRSAYAEKSNAHMLYAKQLQEPAGGAQGYYRSEFSRRQLQFSKANSDDKLYELVREGEDSCPAVAYIASLQIARWSRGVAEELNPVAPVCRFDGLKLPSDFVVYAAGGAQRGRKLGYQIDQSGYEGTQIDVVVNSPDKPVVLVLGGAHEPTVWNVRWTSGTNILAVALGGYHRQAVAGLDKKTSVLVNTSHGQNPGPCGFFDLDSPSQHYMNLTAKSLFGRSVDMIYPANDGNVVVGSALVQGSKLLFSSDVTPESFRDPSAPRPGQAGLQDAVDKGQLRKATAADTEAWSQAVGRRSRERDMYFRDAYVVLQPFAYPAGLYGPDAVSFLILKDVPKPTGNPGHSQVYDFNTLRCRTSTLSCDAD